MIDKIISLAKSQLDKSYVTYCNAMGFNYRIEWCTCFISWLSKSLGLTSIIPINMSCNQQIKQFKAMGVWYTDSNIQRGDVIYYDWDNSGDADHVGIVAEVNGSCLTVIEGNKGDYPNDRVGERKINKTSSLIFGYARPKYPANKVATSIPQKKWTYKYNPQIEALQQILNNKGFNLSVDGQAGDQTLLACKKYTIENGDKGSLTKWVQERLNKLGFNCGVADGIAGNKTMTAIANFQRNNKLGIGYLGGDDWYYLIR